MAKTPLVKPIETEAETDTIESLRAAIAAERQEKRNIAAYAKSERSKGTKLKDQVDKIMKSYSWFHSTIANCSYSLADGTVLAFVPKSKVKDVDSTGKVTEQDTWGEFYTRSPEIKQELRDAAKAGAPFHELKGEELATIRLDIQNSIRDKQSS